MGKKTNTTYENLVTECKRLRHAAETSEAKFFLFLVSVERDYEEVWRAAGCDTFEQFVISNHLCKPDRYRLFVGGLDRTSADQALAHGAYWVIQAGKMRGPSADAMSEYATRATAFAELEHTSPSEETCRQWATELGAKPEMSGVVRRVSELHRLRAENAELRAKLRAAERELATLRKSVAA